MKSYLTRIVLIGCLQIILSTGVALAAEDKIVEIIRSKVEQITPKAGLEIEGAQIASATVLPEVYEENGFRRLWTNPKNVEDLYNAVRTIDEDGLRPDDYHYTIINLLRSRVDSNTSSDPELLADIDILLTDSLIRLGYHLIIGKVDPVGHHPHWNLAVEIDDDEPVTFMQETLEAGNLAKEIEDFRPPNLIYSEYKTALKKYRTIKDNGGWQAVPEGPTLKKGMQGNRSEYHQLGEIPRFQFSLQASSGSLPQQRPGVD